MRRPPLVPSYLQAGGGPNLLPATGPKPPSRSSSYLSDDPDGGSNFMATLEAYATNSNGRRSAPRVPARADPPPVRLPGHCRKGLAIQPSRADRSSNREEPGRERQDRIQMLRKEANEQLALLRGHQREASHLLWRLSTAAVGSWGDLEQAADRALTRGAYRRGFDARALPTRRPPANPPVRNASSGG